MEFSNDKNVTCFSCKHKVFKIIMNKFEDGSRCMGYCDKRSSIDKTCYISATTVCDLFERIETDE